MPREILGEEKRNNKCDGRGKKEIEKKLGQGGKGRIRNHCQEEARGKVKNGGEGEMVKTNGEKESKIWRYDSRKYLAKDS